MPLAIPMLSGPGAITTVILLSQQQKDLPNHLSLTAVITLAVLMLYPMFRLANPLFNKLGVTGTRIATRIMGMILLAIAVEFIVKGVASSFLSVTS